MAIIFILTILILASLYVLISKKTDKIPLISLAITAAIAIFFFLGSLSSAYIDSLSLGMKVFFLSIGFLIIWSSESLIDYEIENKRQPLYYSMILLLLGSLCLIVNLDNLILVYVVLELSAFLSAGIVMIKPERANFRAGIKYLLLSILASAFFLIGMVILYRLTSTFNISQIRELLPWNSDLVRYAFIFIFVGLAFKSALFPFHIWLPDAHGSAPSTSSAILSALVLKAYIILFIKMIYLAFGFELVKSLNFLPIVLILGVAAMIYGSLLAILQENLKDRLAYSSIAQIGYIFMGLGLGTPLGLMAAVFHIIAHGVTKACLFLSAGRIIDRTGLKKTQNMQGLAKSLPVTMAMYTICGLSMIGIPLLVGFTSKWNFAMAIMEERNILLIVVLSLSSLLNGIYFLPLSIRSYFVLDESREREMDLEGEGELPLAILGLLVIVTGIFSNPLIGLLKNIIDGLI